MLEILKNFREDESGVTAVEYGLIGALVVVAAMGAITDLGDSIAEVFMTVQTTIDSVVKP